jgi:AcrR family transcriptional regulator
MKTAVVPSERFYTNTLRAAQAARTREAILDALVRVLARGVAELSIPAVAREAGVSIRTVYRNFPTKRDLLAALDTHLDERIGFSLPSIPGDLAGLTATIRQYFQALDGMDDTNRAARANRIAREGRDTSGLPEKLQAVIRVLDPIAGSLTASDRTHLFNVIATLFSQYTLQRMKEDLGLTGTAAAESVVWAIETLVEAATKTGTSET